MCICLELRIWRPTFCFSFSDVKASQWPVFAGFYDNGLAYWSFLSSRYCISALVFAVLFHQTSIILILRRNPLNGSESLNFLIELFFCFLPKYLFSQVGLDILYGVYWQSRNFCWLPWNQRRFEIYSCLAYTGCFINWITLLCSPCFFCIVHRIDRVYWMLILFWQ